MASRRLSHTLTSLELRASAGSPQPFGATPTQEGVNFAIFIEEAEAVSIVFFEELGRKSLAELSLDPIHHCTGNVWHIQVRGLPPDVLYGYRISSPHHDPHTLILDPYALSISSSVTWGEAKEHYQPLGKVVIPTPFDWRGDHPLHLSIQDLIIYEMHVRGFTRDVSSEVMHPGTYLGLIQKIPHLKSLGINAVELMPVHEFNECEVTHVSPRDGAPLHNYFGYSPVHFFSPMNRYATCNTGDRTREEFKMMVLALHEAGIALILDVVYNHTAEGNEEGPTQSFKALSPHTYYLLDREGRHCNFSGCGNTFNGNHPTAIALIIKSLRYWVTEMHVDGFRFDLASILTRDETGVPLPKAPLLEAISRDPILSRTLLIAEAWDAGGLYQVGHFYPGTRWAEWNGRYRDVVRCFIKGTPGYKTAFATALCGSQDLYGNGRTPTCSINFVTAHDGFSLADLVSYNDKHNEENGEENRDGTSHNDSWNCGMEGASRNKKIVALRARQMHNFHLALMLSQGVPMVLMGDEYGHTKNGNNNTWCQDNSLNWFSWKQLEIQHDFTRFFRSLIHFRLQHPQLRRTQFMTENDITWHGLRPDKPEWEVDNRFLAFSLHAEESPDLFVAFNASHLAQMVYLPEPSRGGEWQMVVNTHALPPHDFIEEGTGTPLKGGDHLLIHSYSAILLKGTLPRPTS